MTKEKLMWHTEKRCVKDLIRYEKNPRTLSPAQLNGLKRSLKKFDLAEIPAINTDGTLIAGNQRILALSLLGRENEEIDVRVPNRTLTKSEFQDYLLTSNRSGGSWDFEKLAKDFDIEELLTAGFDSFDLGSIFDANFEVVDDEFNEEKEIEKAENTNIKQGDYFALGKHLLLCNDATNIKNVQKLMNNRKATLINTDLPFNIGQRYDQNFTGRRKFGGKTKDNKSDKEYELFVKSVMENALSVVKPDAHVMFWCDERWVWLFQKLYKELGIDSKRLCIWIKNNASPTPQIAFNKVTEFCAYGTVGKPWINNKFKNLNEIQNKEIGSGNRLSEDILDLFNIWLVKRLPGSEYEHSTQKNPTLHEKSLRRCTCPGDIVLDLTAGAGSVLSACEQLNRVSYCCEIEPVFCQVIINRFKKISHEKIIKLN